MARNANQLQRDIIDHLRDRYRDGVAVNVNGGRRGYVSFYEWFTPVHLFELISPDEIIDICQPKYPAQFLIEIEKKFSAGFSDLLFVCSRFTGFFEVKTPKDKPTPEQLLFIEIMRRLGHVAGVVRSIEDVEQLIEAAT